MVKQLTLLVLLRKLFCRLELPAHPAQPDLPANLSLVQEQLLMLVNALHVMIQQVSVDLLKSIYLQENAHLDTIAQVDFVRFVLKAFNVQIKQQLLHALLRLILVLALLSALVAQQATTVLKVKC